jgi:hypothetical protein
VKALRLDEFCVVQRFEELDYEIVRAPTFD